MQYQASQYPVPNTQKFWSDRKSHLTDIFNPNKDTIKHDWFWLKIKHDCFWDKKSSYILSIGMLVFLFDFFLSTSVVFYCTSKHQWCKKVLSVGYWTLWWLYSAFSIPSQTKNYSVLGTEEFTFNWFFNTQSVKNTESTNFFPIPNTQNSGTDRESSHPIPGRFRPHIDQFLADSGRKSKSEI